MITTLALLAIAHATFHVIFYTWASPPKTH